MKKCTLFVLLALSCTILWAQDGKWTLGAEGGASLASARGERTPFEGQQPLFAPAAGIILQRALHGRLFFRSGLSLTQKGLRWTGAAIGSNGTVLARAEQTHRLHYFTVPLLVGIHMGSNRGRIYLQAGPWAGFLLRERAELKGPGVNDRADNEGRYRKTDFGLAAGVGGLFPVSRKMAFSLELRDELGLTNSSDIDGPDNGVLRTNALSLLLGVRFGL
ncbi:porin family protein [Flaviaesturariibacter amylovorans]|uniref:Outer membrane protein beta-barrel domain-containing protein n=1 Tax=Flaviaesturariibacter amylovorans TaxID=1084520 RepID=A0ABP8H8R6_9BACT